MLSIESILESNLNAVFNESIFRINECSDVINRNWNLNKWSKNSLFHFKCSTKQVHIIYNISFPPYVPMSQILHIIFPYLPMSLCHKYCIYYFLLSLCPYVTNIAYNISFPHYVPMSQILHIIFPSLHMSLCHKYCI